MKHSISQLTMDSFIPADSADIGVVDKILVKSNSQDSVSQVPGSQKQQPLLPTS